ncbi:DUF6635 family protein [Marinobacter mobilis]|uniref:Uncharacterized protein n=1 Tax=Marinobacter mobilis TaxID=488533 RepID=A0A1H2ZD26_9GAMM|nr:DUF6635 family protein [Marinobacter mobilis]SDX15236.1 hypothetical protein SAMN04487960_106277 [Marinobacter mobilis]
MNSDSKDRRHTSAETRTLIRQAIASGADRYIRGCESRVDDFVRRHYSFRGALRVHAHAMGWDVVRVPINILWSVVHFALAVLSLVAGLVRLRGLQAWLKRAPPGLVTDTDRQISWLVVTELLQLPYQYGNRTSHKDALMEEILRDPAFSELLQTNADTFHGPSHDPGFRVKLNNKLAEYGATRTGSADLVSNVTLLITSKAMLGQAAFGALSAGTVVSAAVAHSVAVSNFWLGSAIGAYYYAVVPATTSVPLLVAVTTLVAVAMALISTFIGIVSDPLQARFGLHHRRLRRLLNAIRDDLQGTHDSTFELREKYLGRLCDIVDVLTTLARTP